MVPDSTPTKTLRLPHIARSRLYLIAQEYPTAGAVRNALDRDLIAIPNISRRTVRKLREALGDTEAMTDICEHGSIRRKCPDCENTKLTARVNELEKRLRIWRDDYERSHDGALVTIPVHQILALIGEE